MDTDFDNDDDGRDLAELAKFQQAARGEDDPAEIKSDSGEDSGEDEQFGLSSAVSAESVLDTSTAAKLIAESLVQPAIEKVSFGGLKAHIWAFCSTFAKKVSTLACLLLL